jgi:hypothetical protein
MMAVVRPVTSWSPALDAATPSGLWVADPNYPGELRQIAWDAKAQEFVPYLSGSTAADSDHAYDLIGLLGKTSLIDWGAVGARWAQLDAGTIGDDRFPVGSVTIETTAADGTKTWEDLRSGPIDSSSPHLGFSISSPGDTIRASFYNGTTYIGYISNGSAGVVPLGYGINDLGVYIESKFGDKWRFVDFQRFELVAPAPQGCQPARRPRPSRSPPSTARRSRRAASPGSSGPSTARASASPSCRRTGPDQRQASQSARDDERVGASPDQWRRYRQSLGSTSSYVLLPTRRPASRVTSNAMRMRSTRIMVDLPRDAWRGPATLGRLPLRAKCRSLGSLAQVDYCRCSVGTRPDLLMVR